MDGMLVTAELCTLYARTILHMMYAFPPVCSYVWRSRAYTCINMSQRGESIHHVRYGYVHIVCIKPLYSIPKLVSTANLQKGEIQSTRDDGILSLKWRDKRDVLMLSTFHDDTMVGKSRRSRTAVGGVETIQKPQVVEEYNQFMGGVDKSK